MAPRALPILNIIYGVTVDSMVVANCTASKHQNNHNDNAGAMSWKFGDSHSLKRYVPELITGVIFDVYDQHTQIITELDIKLKKVAYYN